MAAPVNFKAATRKQAKASILIEGLSGSGKTGLALELAHTLANDDWEKVYATDSENKSMCLYVGAHLSTDKVVGNFNVAELSNDTGYKPTLYQYCRDYAIKHGGLVWIGDSLTHMWQAKGGVLDMVANAGQTNKDKYAVWNDPEIKHEKNTIMDLIRSPKIHTINTVRVKEKMNYSTDDNGKTVLEKLGELPIIAPEIDYEPDLVLRMVKAGNANGDAPIAKVEKSRYAILTEGETYVFTKSLQVQLREYLNEGVDPETLLEEQRQDYIKAITEYLNNNASAKNIWEILKDNAGQKGVKLKDIPLDVIKKLYSDLASD